MTKEQLRRILTRLDFWREYDKKHNDALKAYCEVIAPSSYAPIIEVGCVEGFIEGVSRGDKRLEDDLSYYAYEVPNMKPPVLCRCKGVEYDASDIDQYIDFMLASTQNDN